MGGSSYSNVDCDEVSGLVTASQMLLKSELQSLNTDVPSSSDGDNSYVASMSEGCESSLSSWDSEPETDIPSLINCHGMPEENYLDLEEQNQFVGVENSDDGLLWEMDNRSYDNLLKKFMEKEDELRFSNFRLQLLEQENIDLKVLVENGEVQLDNVIKESKLKEEELHKQKELSEEEIFKLKSQIKKVNNWLNTVHEELNRKVEGLKKQKEDFNNFLNDVNEELKLNEEELNKQKELFEKEIFKLKTQIEKSEIQLKNVNEELKLKEEELNVQKELSEEEIFKLKSQIEKSEIHLNNVHEELKLKEEELNVQKELSEEEIFKLKIQIEKSENQLDNVQEELNLKQEELQKQIAELDTHIPQFVHKITNLVEQLEVAHENLKISKDEIASLRMELESKSSETNLLQGQLKVAQKNMAKSELELVSERKQNQVLGDLVKMYEANETNQDQEVWKLKSEMLDLQAKFSLEKDKLHFDIASLSKMKIELTSKLEDCDSRNKESENKLRQYEAEKLKQEELYVTQHKFFEDEIGSLMEDHGQRMDMVMIELEKANNMIDYLKAEICSRDGKISNVKKYTDDVKTSLKELMAAYDTALNEENNLKLRVGELENEVTRQNGVISNMVEEKKEAIRQLCCSVEHYKSKLEHYKNGYNELLLTLYG